jgi:DNA-binding MltR family transcriptional regulator
MDKIDHTKLQSIINKFQKESDRACAILAVATLDAILENLLRKSMIPEVPKDVFEGNSPLHTFSAKIDTAYSFGLISGEERGDLHTLRMIRNDFAHDVDHELSFDTPKVTDRVRSLKMRRMFEANAFITEEFNTTRSHFELCLVTLAGLVRDVRTKNAKQPSKLVTIKPIARPA